MSVNIDQLEEKSSARREEILENVRECFAEYGYEGATVRRLEKATGKSRGAIFHHFGDKESLFFALAQEDALRMADVVSENGLVELMRDMLGNPARYNWLMIRVETAQRLRTDSDFRSRWLDQQSVLDKAVRKRLSENADRGKMRTDVPIEVLHMYLETVMDGFITRIATGSSTEGLEKVLDFVESSVRKGD